VVKPYITISDAFKIKETLILMMTTIQKEIIRYTIFSFPVASTFTPSKEEKLRELIRQKSTLV
jgi:hypothetical protein